MAGSISFDKKTYEKLKREYRKAVEEGIEVFIFEGHELLTSYAKYVLEYLKPKFEK